MLRSSNGHCLVTCSTPEPTDSLSLSERERAGVRVRVHCIDTAKPMSHHSHFGAHTDPTFTARPRSTWEVIRRVAVYLRPYRWLAVGTVGCAVLSLIFAFAFPKLTQFIIDEVIGHQRSDLLGPVIAGLLGAFVLRDFFNCLRIRINNTFEQNVIYDMRRDVYARLQDRKSTRLNSSHSRASRMPSSA